MTMRLESATRTAGMVLLAGTLALWAAPAWAHSIGLDGNYQGDGYTEDDGHHHDGDGGWTGPVEGVDGGAVQVAEPSSLILMGMGLLGAAVLAGRRRGRA